MFKILLSQFIKQNGRNPNNLEMILLRQKAANQAVDERKVVNMFDREPVNPNKPILGGKNIDETEEQIRQRLIKQNEQGIANLKNKLDDPEKKAMGGRIGYKLGAGKKGVQALLDLVRDKFGKKAINVVENEPDFGLNILNDYNIARPESAVIRDTMKNFGKSGKFNKDGSIDYDYYAEILNDSENTFVYGDETIEELEKMAKARLDEIAEYKAMYDRGELDKYAPSKLDNVNDDQIAAAVDDIFPTGDPKYDAEMASEALVENNPQIFGDNVLLDDLDDATRSKIYGAVYDVLSNNMGKMRELKRLSKPEKTLQSMKEGKGIDMSDPEIADEFGRFMKETDPKGYKELEQKVELSNFNPKGRKKNADGGIMRAPFVGGGMGRRGFLKLLGSVGAGAAALKTGLMGLAKKSEPVVEVVKETAQEVPSYFFSLVNKIRSLGDDTLATQDKTISKKYKDYVMEEDFAGNIEIIKKGDDVAEDVFMSYKVDEVPLKKGGSRKVEEYEEYTARPDMEGKMKDIEPGVPDNVIEEAMSEAPSIKKASGGIARMLGE